MKHLQALSWLSILAFLFLIGCQPKQQEPVRSTTATGTSVAPSGQSADNRGFALVRFVNASPTIASADAFMDSVNVFNGVSFKTITPYKEVPEGRHTFHLGREGAMQGGGTTADNTRNENNRGNRIENSESLSGGQYYTVILLPPEEKKQGGGTSATREEKAMPKMEIVKDDFGSPSTDKAKVRVINAATGYNDVDLYSPSKNDNLIKGISFNGEHSYKDIDPQSGSLQIRDSDKKATLATLPAESFQAGKAYTIVLTGDKAAGQKLNVVTVEDQFTRHPGRDSDQDKESNSDRNRDNTQGSGSDRDRDNQ